MSEQRHGLESFMASLPQAAGSDAVVNIQILPELGHINLRGDPGMEEFVEQVSATLGQQLPLEANKITTGEHRVFWLGPDEWLIITERTGTQDLITRLRESLSGQRASVTDQSGGQLALRLIGPHARDVLAKGCTLDFHPDVFSAGDCAQSGLAKANVMIGMLDEHPTYEIVVRRSFSEYLVRWLQAASREYGFGITVR